MKKRGCTVAFADEREYAVLTAFLNIAPQPTCKAIYKAIEDSPAPRLWISEERAAAVYSLIKKGHNMLRAHKRRKLMYEEMVSRVDAIMASGEDNLNKAIAKAIYMPAPSFFLSPSTIGTILNTALRKRGRNEYRR